MDITKYNRGVKQVESYLDTTKKNTGQCWRGGNYNTIQHFTAQMPKIITLGENIYNITMLSDISSQGPVFSGLIFYKADKKARPNNRRKELTDDVKEPVLSPTEKRRLQETVDDVKRTAQQEGWSGLDIVGLILVLALIVAIAYFAGMAIVAIIALLLSSSALASAGVNDNGINKKSSLIDSLKAAFGIKISKDIITSYANKKLNDSIDWIKGWFKGMYLYA